MYQHLYQVTQVDSPQILACFITRKEIIFPEQPSPAHFCTSLEESFPLPRVLNIYAVQGFWCPKALKHPHPSRSPSSLHTPPHVYSYPVIPLLPMSYGILGSPETRLSSQRKSADIDPDYVLVVSREARSSKNERSASGCLRQSACALQSSPGL